MRYFIFFVVFLLSSCKSDQENYAPSGLKKLDGEELIERARVGNFPKINELIYKNQRGEIIERDSLKLMASIEELAYDDYTDEHGVVKVTVVRPATEEDKILRARINLAIQDGPPLSSIDVNCSTLGPLFDSIQILDQNNRISYENLDQRIDLRNLEYIVSILEKCGMPARESFSQDHINTVWLVLQHAALKYQKEYLPLLLKSVEKGDLSKSKVFMMQDRILMKEGKPQIYGTQISKNSKTGEFELYNVGDPEYLDFRRLQAGFQPINEYLENWNITFDTPQENLQAQK